LQTLHSILSRFRIPLEELKFLVLGQDGNTAVDGEQHTSNDMKSLMYIGRTWYLLSKFPSLPGLLNSSWKVLENFVESNGLGWGVLPEI
jgi:hypothetical protein